MYIDKKGGTSRHAGYVIAGLWIILFFVTRFEKLALKETDIY
jgi:hypothetical protein